MWSILANVSCELGKNVYSAVGGWSSPWLSMVSSWLTVFLSSTMFFLSAISVYLGERGFEVSNYNSGFIYFCLQFHQILPYVFYCSVARCIHFKDCYTFVENWPLNHYVMSLFIPDNFPCSEVHSVRNYYSYSHFLLISISMVTVFYLLPLFFVTILFSTLFVPFEIFIEYFIWFSIFSPLLAYQLYFFLLLCLVVSLELAIHLQLIQVHFQMTLYCFTSSASTL